MQKSELYRREIVLPLDEAAEEALRLSNVSEATRVRFLRIADDEWFEELWQRGLFREINAKCATLLDDYEEEMIDAASSEGIIAAVDAILFGAITAHPDLVRFLEDLRDLARQSSRLSRPLFFVL